MRDINKAIEDYKKQFVNKDNDKFLLSDMLQLKELSTDTLDAVYNSCYAGFMIGYRFGLKESKRGV